MSIKTALACLVFAALAAFVARAADDKEQKKEEPKKDAPISGLERFKQLAGDWTGTMNHDGGKPSEVTVNYKVTSAGSAVVETIAPNDEHEMVTVIHQDGKHLALTHYCALGNQPRMKADAKGDGNKFEFDFDGASNLESENDMHMHSVTYTFVDKNTLKAEWAHYNEGKETGKAVIKLKRKK
jgi:hypothetical protein